jgi:hypothetical protein
MHITRGKAIGLGALAALVCGGVWVVTWARDEAGRMNGL